MAGNENPDFDSEAHQEAEKQAWGQYAALARNLTRSAWVTNALPLFIVLFRHILFYRHEAEQEEFYAENPNAVQDYNPDMKQYEQAVFWGVIAYRLLVSLLDYYTTPETTAETQNNPATKEQHQEVLANYMFWNKVLIHPSMLLGPGLTNFGFAAFSQAQFGNLPMRVQNVNHHYNMYFGVMDLMGSVVGNYQHLLNYKLQLCSGQIEVIADEITKTIAGVTALNQQLYRTPGIQSAVCKTIDTKTGYSIRFVKLTLDTDDKGEAVADYLKETMRTSQRHWPVVYKPNENKKVVYVVPYGDDPTNTKAFINQVFLNNMLKPVGIGAAGGIDRYVQAQFPDLPGVQALMTDLVSGVSQPGKAPPDDENIGHPGSHTTTRQRRPGETTGPS